MASYFVPGVADLEHQTRMSLGNPAQNEKCSRHRMAIQKRQDFVSLPLHPGRHRAPPTRVRRNAQLARVKVLLEIDAQSICHSGELADSRDRIRKRITAPS